MWALSKGILMRIRALKICCLMLVPLTVTGILSAEKGSKPSRSSAKGAETRLKSDTFTGLAFRGIGPAVTSGRVGDIAIHPTDRNTWYVVAASGGVWKTINAGVTWTPIFDGEGSYSIGSVTVVPKHHMVIWVGTGETNSIRRLVYDCGCYNCYYI